MTRSRRPSPQTATVLSALAADATTWRYGYELSQEVELKAGSLYPILIRLCDRGLLEASWEQEPPAGRPPRHLYRLTGAGVQLAATVRTTATARASGTAPATPTVAPASSRSTSTVRGADLRSAW